LENLIGNFFVTFHVTVSLVQLLPKQVCNVIQNLLFKAV